MSQRIKPADIIKLAQQIEKEVTENLDTIGTELSELKTKATKNLDELVNLKEDFAKIREELHTLKTEQDKIALSVRKKRLSSRTYEKSRKIPRAIRFNRRAREAKPSARTGSR